MKCGRVPDSNANAWQEKASERRRRVVSMSDELDLDLLGDFRADPTEHGRDAGSAPAMLRFKLLKPGGKPKPRERWALPYTLLKRCELESPSKLVLLYAGVTVTIE